MINLEKEIRQQPEALAGVFDLNLPTIREIVKKAKEADVHGIYFAARGTSDHACKHDGTDRQKPQSSPLPLPDADMAQYSRRQLHGIRASARQP